MRIKKSVLYGLVGLLFFLGIGWLLFGRQQILTYTPPTPTVTPTPKPQTTVTPQQILIKDDNASYYKSAKGYFVTINAKSSKGLVLIPDGIQTGYSIIADRLAQEGYIVLLADIHASQSASISMTNVESAVTYLKGKGADKVGVIGWGQGGTYALQLAQPELKPAAIVQYYPTTLPQTEKQIASVVQPVLSFFAGRDTRIPQESIQIFARLLDDKGVANEIYLYQEANAGFALPTQNSYSKKDSDDAWTRTLLFLEEHL